MVLNTSLSELPGIAILLFSFDFVYCLYLTTYVIFKTVPGFRQNTRKELPEAELFLLFKHI
jgi:hypothetical protein